MVTKIDYDKRADEDLARLREEYDADKGGYNVITPARLGHKEQTTFYKSKFTPEQGGYYADESITGPAPYDGTTVNAADPSTFRKGINDPTFYDKDRTSYITTSSGGIRPASKKGIKTETGGAVQREKDAARLASARVPYKRVNTSLTRSRSTNRKQRALTYGRSGTILTGTLGGGTDDKKKKRMLLG